MSFNFYTMVKYFWVLMFVVFVMRYLFTWELDALAQIGLSVVMIIIFAAVDGYYEDRKVLSKR